MNATPSPIVKCPTCGGTGEIPRLNGMIDGRGMMAECPDCQGVIPTPADVNETSQTVDIAKPNVNETPAAEDLRCHNNGGRSLGAGHVCRCNHSSGHAGEHGCECGAIWGAAQPPAAPDGTDTDVGTTPAAEHELMQSALCSCGYAAPNALAMAAHLETYKAQPRRYEMSSIQQLVNGQWIIVGRPETYATEYLAVEAIYGRNPKTLEDCHHGDFTETTDGELICNYCARVWFSHDPKPNPQGGK